jgi:hypothetical protein
LADWTERDLVGSTVLIGLTFVSANGDERLQTYIGKINEFKPAGEEFENLNDGQDSAALLVDCHDGETREFPFSREAIEVADPGFYELPDGATIENPDFEMHWRITEPAKH